MHLLLVACCVVVCCGVVSGHARLVSPPARSSMWRQGYDTEKNFDDDGLYCGGIQVQWQRNGGKCGICGDPYDMPHPRDNEAGGKYARGIITRRYRTGQTIEASVDVTTNHKGFFEFRVCPNTHPKKEVTQECLDKHLLKLAQGGTRYNITGKGNGNITVKLRLPKGLVCSKCVFQWTYTAGNNWGKCDNGESRLGCGPQETFKNCADITILKHPNTFTYKSDQNEIRGKASTSSAYYKTIKQKLLKETTQYPTYTTEFTGETFEDNSTFITENSTKELNTDISKQPFPMWMTTDTSVVSVRNTDSIKPHKRIFRFQNRNGDYFPAMHRSSGRFFKKDNAAFSSSPSVLVVNEGTRLSNMFQNLQEEMELLRFYFQEDPATSSVEEISSGQSSSGRTGIVKDFWYL